MKLGERWKWWVLVWSFLVAFLSLVALVSLAEDYGSLRARVTALERKP